MIASLAPVRGMRQRHQSEAASGGSTVIVVFRREPCDGIGKIVRERGARRRAREADLGFDRERRKPTAFGGRARRQIGDFAKGACRGGRQVSRAESVAVSALLTERAERLRRDQKRARGGLEHALSAIAATAFFDALDEPLFLELAEVIVQALPRDVQPSRQARG